MFKETQAVKREKGDLNMDKFEEWIKTEIKEIYDVFGENYHEDLVGEEYGEISGTITTLKMCLKEYQRLKREKSATDFEQHYKNIKEGKSTWR